MLTIRPATTADLEAIREIYNDAVLTSTATFDTEPRTPEEQVGWFEEHDDRHPVLVAEQDGLVVGWACLSAWSPRPAYRDTAETSVYVHRDHRGRGVGRHLKQASIDEAVRLGFHVLIARVAEGSGASLHLNNRFGFELVGTLRQVGYKFGRYVDVHVLQKILD